MHLQSHMYETTSNGFNQFAKVQVSDMDMHVWKKVGIEHGGHDS